MLITVGPPPLVIDTNEFVEGGKEADVYTQKSRNHLVYAPGAKFLL